MHERPANLKNSSDEALVVASILGDVPAFDELVGRYRSAVELTAYRLLGNVTLAQEVAQDAFLLAFENLPKLDEPQAFPGFDEMGIAAKLLAGYLYLEQLDFEGLLHLGEVGKRIRDEFRGQGGRGGVRISFGDEDDDNETEDSETKRGASAKDSESCSLDGDGEGLLRFTGRTCQQIRRDLQMIRTTLAAFAIVALLSGSPARAQSPGEAEFKLGVQSIEKRQYTEALGHFLKARDADPEEPSILWNLALAAAQCDRHVEAKTALLKLKAQDTNDGFARSKLVQAYQALKDFPARDRERAELLALRRSGKDTSDLAKRPSFCREQITLGKRRLFAMEPFDFKPRSESGRFAERYSFLLTGEDGKTEQRIEVGWNEVEKNKAGVWVPSGPLSAFYFDDYFSTGPYSRKTFGLFTHELPYDECRAHVLKIIEGKVPMTSGRPR